MWMLVTLISSKYETIKYPAVSTRASLVISEKNTAFVFPSTPQNTTRIAPELTFVCSLCGPSVLNVTDATLLVHARNDLSLSTPPREGSVRRPRLRKRGRGTTNHRVPVANIALWRNLGAPS